MESLAVSAAMVLSTVFVVGSFAGILLIIAAKGIPSLSLSMITETSTGGLYLGSGGGILNAIVGSLAVAVGAVLLAFVASTGIVVFLTVYSKKRSGVSRAIRFGFDSMIGVPSIVYGAFGFNLMILLGMRASLIAGVITVAVLVLPVMVRFLDEAVSSTPAHLREAAASLGATRAQTAFRVTFRQAIPGIVTALLLSFGRAIGDAASVLFTAGFSDRIPTSLADPTATLPLTIFFLASSPAESVRRKAYAAAFVLTFLVLAVSIFSRITSRRLGRYVIK